MPKVSKEYMDNKRLLIIDAAQRVLEKKTMSTITMQDVINESGLSQGGIYRFFKDVDEILAEMISILRGRIDIISKVDEIAASNADFETKFKALADIPIKLMEDDIYQLGKTDYEIALFAINYPERINKILSNTTRISNKGYLRSAMYKLVKDEVERRLNSGSKMYYTFDDIISYIVYSYTGIETEAVFNKYYASPGQTICTLSDVRRMFTIMTENAINMINKEVV